MYMRIDDLFVRIPIKAYFLSVFLRDLHDRVAVQTNR